MKRIATELGAGTMTVYYYVRNKTDVVALMHDAILAGVLIPGPELPGGWRDAIAAIARRTRQVLVAHPWSLASLGDAQFGPNALRHLEQSLAAVPAPGSRPPPGSNCWPPSTTRWSATPCTASSPWPAPGPPEPTPPWPPR